MSTKAQRGEVVGIQYLRAVAAIMVVFHHARDQIPALHALIPTTALQGGVDIFFVISGFIMTYTTAQKPMTPAVFLERRLARIVPLYWTMTIVTAALAIGAPRLFKDTTFTVSSFLTSLFFVPAYNPGVQGEVSPMLKLGWTLNYEMFFYLVFAILLFLAPLRRVVALFAVFALLAILLPLTHTAFAPAIFYSNPITLEFVLGCAIGALSSRGAVASPKVAWPLFVAGIIALFWFGSGNIVGINRVFNLGFAAAVIVLATASLDLSGAFTANGPISRSLKTLGDASYSIYLTHLFPLILFRTLWLRAALPSAGTVPMIIFILLAGVATVSVSVAIYFVIERPVTRRARLLINAVKPRSRTLPASTQLLP